MTPPRLSLGLALAAAVALAAPASAHHSFNMFDHTKSVTMTGTVKSYAFKMPHVWFFIDTPQSGGVEEWGMEMGSPNLAARKGWHINSLKAGDKVTVTMRPMKDGSKAGMVLNVVMPDGRTLLN